MRDVRLAGEGLEIVLTPTYSGCPATEVIEHDVLAAIDAAGRSGPGALLLTAEGSNFCVGADVKHLATVLDDLPAKLSAMADGFHAALADLAALSIPIVAAVQGHAVGAGFGLAMMADVIFAADDARFSTGYARLGLSADAGVSCDIAPY